STSSHCVGCGGRIHDQWILRVAPNLEWHAACLKCAECQQFLDEHCTCFVRDGKTYCKRDYVRLFGTKCDKCSECFSKDDYVMRARSKIYHIKCFRCSACMRQLVPGDEFALRQDGLFCRHDHDVLEGGKLCSGPGGVPGSENNNNASLMNNNHHLHPNDGSISVKPGRSTGVLPQVNNSMAERTRHVDFYHRGQMSATYLRITLSGHGLSEHKEQICKREICARGEAQRALLIPRCCIRITGHN
ncbi:hypothetical protein K0M31_007188, partial [Melipona bicolor]